MLYRAFPVEERAKAAIGVLGVAVLAPAIGPLLGGILVDEASWRWIFYINGPIGVVAFVLSWYGGAVVANHRLRACTSLAERKARRPASTAIVVASSS